MRFLVFNLVCGWILANSPGCNSKNKNDQTKIDLQKIASSLNFMQWYKGEVQKGKVLNTDEDHVNALNLTNFGSHPNNKNHVIHSPYFWSSLWFVYELEKTSTMPPIPNALSKKLDEQAIKKIFQTYTNENHSNKEFVTSILSFVGNDPSATAPIDDLKKGTTATDPVNNFESFILSGVNHSINTLLKSCNVGVNSTTEKFYLKDGIFTEDGSLKEGFKTTTELTALAGEAIRGLTILKGSIEKMIPKFSNQSNAIEAVNEKEKQVQRINHFIGSLESTFGVQKNTYDIRTIITNNKESSTGEKIHITHFVSTEEEEKTANKEFQNQNAIRDGRFDALIVHDIIMSLIANSKS